MAAADELRDVLVEAEGHGERDESPCPSAWT